MTEVSPTAQALEPTLSVDFTGHSVASQLQVGPPYHPLVSLLSLLLCLPAPTPLPSFPCPLPAGVEPSDLMHTAQSGTQQQQQQQQQVAGGRRSRAEQSRARKPAFP